MTRNYFAAEIRDPLTGHMITISAENEEQLDQFIDHHLTMRYPDPAD